MSNSNPTVGTKPEEMVAAALNEHGFLLQQIVRQKLQGRVDPEEDNQNQWEFVASEYPVTAADDSQTRVDLLLHHHQVRGLYMCLECKRPHPRFKKWIFFDRERNVAGMSATVGRVESIFVSQRHPEAQILHR